MDNHNDTERSLLVSVFFREDVVSQPFLAHNDYDLVDDPSFRFLPSELVRRGLKYTSFAILSIGMRLPRIDESILHK
jgi:hypothetical protein